MEVLSEWRSNAVAGKGSKLFRRVAIGLALLAAIAGAGALAVVALSVALPSPFVALAQRAVDSIDLAQMVFADGRMFWSYEA
ncbi:MAG: hypothetical protein KDE54_18190, partial [Caldilineaceae bacterium]|nr:hypothetical protein [Caldilineaceae bacterium]